MTGGKDGTVKLWGPDFSKMIRAYDVSYDTLAPGEPRMIHSSPKIRALAVAKVCACESSSSLRQTTNEHCPLATIIGGNNCCHHGWRYSEHCGQWHYDSSGAGKRGSDGAVCTVIAFAAGWAQSQLDSIGPWRGRALGSGHPPDRTHLCHLER